MEAARAGIWDGSARTTLTAKLPLPRDPEDGERERQRLAENGPPILVPRGGDVNLDEAGAGPRAVNIGHRGLDPLGEVVEVLAGKQAPRANDLPADLRHGLHPELLYGYVQKLQLSDVGKSHRELHFRPRPLAGQAGQGNRHLAVLDAERSQDHLATPYYASDHVNPPPIEMFEVGEGDDSIRGNGPGVGLVPVELVGRVQILDVVPKGDTREPPYHGVHPLLTAYAQGG